MKPIRVLEMFKFEQLITTNDPTLLSHFEVIGYSLFTVNLMYLFSFLNCQAELQHSLVSPWPCFKHLDNLPGLTMDQLHSRMSSSPICLECHLQWRSADVWQPVLRTDMGSWQEADRAEKGRAHGEKNRQSDRDPHCYDPYILY